ncbi:porin family protein [Zhouia amylolytica]|uniref:Outer membrane protein beta-barrel domain-containing protein n=1 Tax=Zhouia amylolytica AD3 TaxID=1286632 RepID=W2UM76_9FLAO|nr:porin family protein [Zhouia amylolytica]ETN94432.1 hypothetical protein P278_23750 [Zhouia amylolytica AD3]
MRCPVILFFILFNVVSSHAQELDSLLNRAPDTKYLEDQFYIGIGYNALLNKPEGIKQSSLSYGLHFGFIKDIPLNQKRNIALGVGLGYAVNSFYENLMAYKENGVVLYDRIPDSVDFKRNKIESHSIDFPLELRFRTSDTQTHSFWRVHTGLKIRYAFANRSRYIDEESHISFDNPDVNKLQYGAYLSVGYNTWNVYVQYQLNDLFDNAITSEGEPIAMNVLHLGLIFYIL